jgi:hypothetical protein
MTTSTVHPEAAILALALQSVVAALSQPVQFSGADGPGTAAILRADAAYARKVAEDALSTVAVLRASLPRLANAQEVRS